MNIPECIPQSRVCPGCGLCLQLSSENWPTRHTEPHRYPWQPSYYRSPCKACRVAMLRDLKVATKKAQHRKKSQKRRDLMKAARASLGMTPEAIKAHRTAQAARKAEALRKAKVKAWVGHIMPRLPYDPAADPIKIKIRLESQAAMRRRLQASPFLQRLAQGLPEPSEGPKGPADSLDALRARASRGWRED